MFSLSLSFTISRAASPHGFIHSASPHRCFHLNPFYIMKYDSPTPINEDLSVPAWVKVLAFFWFVCYFGRFLYALILE